jgi:formylglycine-generating enzyme required for sulfatase activity
VLLRRLRNSPAGGRLKQVLGAAEHRVARSLAQVAWRRPGGARFGRESCVEVLFFSFEPARVRPRAARWSAVIAEVAAEDMSMRRQAVGVVAMFAMTGCEAATPAAVSPRTQLEQQKLSTSNEANGRVGDQRDESQPAQQAAKKREEVSGSKIQSQYAQPEVVEAREVRMAELAGGTYTMGNKKLAIEEETVVVRPFALDITEVTVDAYARCMNQGKCSAPEDTDSLCNWGKPGRGNHPINCVDAMQAEQYCLWVGKRLPTEPEWVWAARGQARGTTYPWGNEAPGSRACWNRYGKGTCSVGSFPSSDSPEGIHDLAGNVWEWFSTPIDITTVKIYAHGGGYDAVNPLSLSVFPKFLTPSNTRSHAIGFRCAKDR